MIDLGGIEWDVVFRPEYRAMLLGGVKTTLLLMVSGLAGGFSLGAVFAFARLTPSRWISLPVAVYVEITRSIPLLVHLMFWYFAVPIVLPAMIRDWLYQQNVAVYATIVALILYSAAFISEDIRSGIRAISQGQREAARSLGFGFFDTFRLVVLPQAFRNTVPALMGQALTLCKNTTVGLMVGAAELAYVTRAVKSSTFLSVGVYAFTTVFFLLIAAVLAFASRAYQRRQV